MWTRKGILAAGGAAVAAAAAGCGGEDDDERRRQMRTAADLEIVRFLLQVERVTSAFWQEAARRDALAPVNAANLTADIARNEQGHVDILVRYERRLAGQEETQTTPAPTTDFAPVFAAGPSEVLRTGAGLANLAASAYMGQLNRVQDRTLLGSMLAIHTVEGRHGAAVNRAAGQTDQIFPDGAFAEPATMAQVRSRLRRYAT
ncbi:MAG TPA: ferritin-like domain-containing protein [Solirubrobacteraceae bacterium]|nr:ferritin-like domain-containing protein [Solirubrobacteraceae bacterium]